MSSLKKYLVGNTIRFSWISSGDSPTSLTLGIIDGSETVVSSVSMIDSSNGHYFLDQTLPSSSGYFVAEYKADIGGKPYIRRSSFKTIRSEVD